MEKNGKKNYRQIKTCLNVFSTFEFYQFQILSSDLWNKEDILEIAPKELHIVFQISPRDSRGIL